MEIENSRCRIYKMFVLVHSYHILPDKVSITDLNTTFAGTSVMTLAEDDNDEPFALNISTNNSVSNGEIPRFVSLCKVKRQ